MKALKWSMKSSYAQGEEWVMWERACARRVKSRKKKRKKKAGLLRKGWGGKLGVKGGTGCCYAHFSVARDLISAWKGNGRTPTPYARGGDARCSRQSAKKKLGWLFFIDGQVSLLFSLSLPEYPHSFIPSEPLTTTHRPTTTGSLSLARVPWSEKTAWATSITRIRWGKLAIHR